MFFVSRLQQEDQEENQIKQIKATRPKISVVLQRREARPLLMVEARWVTGWVPCWLPWLPPSTGDASFPTWSCATSAASRCIVGTTLPNCCDMVVDGVGVVGGGSQSSFFEQFLPKIPTFGVPYHGLQYFVWKKVGIVPITFKRPLFVWRLRYFIVEVSG